MDLGCWLKEQRIWKIYRWICHECETASHPHHGIYNRGCPGCGAREVVMDRPMKSAQEGILMFYGAAMREEILQMVKKEK